MTNGHTLRVPIDGGQAWAQIHDGQITDTGIAWYDAYPTAAMKQLRRGAEDRWAEIACEIVDEAQELERRTRDCERVHAARDGEIC